MYPCHMHACHCDSSRSCHVSMHKVTEIIMKVFAAFKCRYLVNRDCSRGEQLLLTAVQSVLVVDGTAAALPVPCICCHACTGVSSA
jgi:hypothetical protein